MITFYELWERIHVIPDVLEYYVSETNMSQPVYDADEMQEFVKKFGDTPLADFDIFIDSEDGFRLFISFER